MTDKSNAYKDSKKGVTFGIVGGLGPIAGADIFTKLVRSTPAHTDREHYNIILEQITLDDVHARADKNYNPSRRKIHVYNVIKNFVERNVTAVLLPCFVSHTFLKELQSEFDIPIVDMMEALKNHIENKYSSFRKIGVMTSDYARKMKLFENKFPKKHFELVYPDDEIQQKYMMEAVYGKSGIKAGFLSGQSIEYMQKTIENLISKGAELICPGFTEIPVVLRQLNSSIPIIDSNNIYVNHAIAGQTQVKYRSHIVGIIGGLGPAATVDFMDKIIRNTPAEKDQDHIKMIVEHNPHIPDRTQNLISNGEDPTIPLYSSAKKLENEGVSLIAVPCNTAHVFIERIQKYLSVPIINMIDETAEYICRNYPKVKEIGLLATSGTIKTRIYHNAFESKGLEVLTPDNKYQALVMDAIYGEKGIKSGGDMSLAKETLSKVIAKLMNKNIGVIVLGCTELPIPFGKDKICVIKNKKIPLIDPTDILAKKCVKLILNMEKN